MTKQNVERFRLRDPSPNGSMSAVVILLASASKTYIGSVLFRASAFTGAKLASGVPAVIGHFGP